MKKIPYSTPDIFLIYFDTATFDQIQKDTKMKMETMVGVVGGTMGLLTGFSILSGVEVLYYLCKVFFSMINRKVKTLPGCLNTRILSRQQGLTQPAENLSQILSGNKFDQDLILNMVII